MKPPTDFDFCDLRTVAQIIEASRPAQPRPAGVSAQLSGIAGVGISCRNSWRVREKCGISGIIMAKGRNAANVPTPLTHRAYEEAR